MFAKPVGQFADYVDGGFGLDGNFTLWLDQAGIFGLRADGGFLIYGSETKRVCFSQTVGCRIEVDVTTTNSIFLFNFGPQISAPLGPVRPYGNASIGFSYFWTESRVEDVSDNGDIASTTNFDDATFAYFLGGGLNIGLSSGRMPIGLDFGVRYNSNGNVEYLREGDITDNPDGSITLTPQTSDANLVTFVLGVTLGIRW